MFFCFHALAILALVLGILQTSHQAHDFGIPGEFDVALLLKLNLSGWILKLCTACTAFWLCIHLMMEEGYEVDIETCYSVRFNKGKPLQIPSALLVEDMQGDSPNSHHLIKACLEIPFCDLWPCRIRKETLSSSCLRPTSPSTASSVARLPGMLLLLVAARCRSWSTWEMPSCPTHLVNLKLVKRLLQRGEGVWRQWWRWMCMELWFPCCAPAKGHSWQMWWWSWNHRCCLLSSSSCFQTAWKRPLPDPAKSPGLLPRRSRRKTESRAEKVVWKCGGFSKEACMAQICLLCAWNSLAHGAQTHLLSPAAQ